MRAWLPKGISGSFQIVDCLQRGSDDPVPLSNVGVLWMSRHSVPFRDVPSETLSHLLDPHSTLIMALTRVASASTANGLVIISIPGSRKPFASVAFSA